MIFRLHWVRWNLGLSIWFDRTWAAIVCLMSFGLTKSGWFKYMYLYCKGSVCKYPDLIRCGVIGSVWWSPIDWYSVCTGCDENWARCTQVVTVCLMVFELERLVKYGSRFSGWCSWFNYTHVLIVLLKQHMLSDPSSSHKFDGIGSFG